MNEKEEWEKALAQPTQDEIESARKSYPSTVETWARYLKLFAYERKQLLDLARSLVEKL